MFDDLRDLYQETILERGRRPRHATRLAAFDATARGDNPMCGDRCQVWLKRAADGTLDAVGFEARGCAISVASADLMTEAVRGLDAGAARRLARRFRELVGTGTAEDPALDTLRPLAGVHEYPSRVKCATLPWDALEAALNDKEASHG